MNNAQLPSHTRVVQLEVVPEDEQQVDIADIDQVGRSLFDQLTNGGYTVKPVTTGKKGGEPLFEILLQIPQFLHENKDWLLASIPPVLESLLIVRDRLAEREKTRRTPLKITLEVNGKPVIIETADLKNITKLVKQLQTDSPQEAKIQVRVPKKKRHA